METRRGVREEKNFLNSLSVALERRGRKSDETRERKHADRKRNDSKDGSLREK